VLPCPAILIPGLYCLRGGEDRALQECNPSAPPPVDCGRIPFPIGAISASVGIPSCGNAQQTTAQAINSLLYSTKSLIYSEPFVLYSNPPPATNLGTCENPCLQAQTLPQPQKSTNSRILLHLQNLAYLHP